MEPIFEHNNEDLLAVLISKFSKRLDLELNVIEYAYVGPGIKQRTWLHDDVDVGALLSHYWKSKSRLKSICRTYATLRSLINCVDPLAEQ